MTNKGIANVGKDTEEMTLSDVKVQHQGNQMAMDEYVAGLIE